jgi:hypothetical protein
MSSLAAPYVTINLQSFCTGGRGFREGFIKPDARLERSALRIADETMQKLACCGSLPGRIQEIPRAGN